MRKLKTLLLPLLALALASCVDELDSPASDYAATSSPANDYAATSRVVVVYMMAENSLSDYALSDLNEMRAACDQIPDGCSLVVFFDNSDSSTKPQIISFDKARGEHLLYEYGEDVVSTDSTVMLDALRRVVEGNAAEEYALILWSHGSGWIPYRSDVATRTIGVDNGNNSKSDERGTEMEITTLRHVLEKLGVKWRYVMYDACFMQCVEVAYELRGLTEWSIGTPAETPAYGADYTTMMPDFFAKETFAEDITSQYFDLYRNNYGMLISAIRSDGLDRLAQVTAEALTPLSDFPTDGIQHYCEYTRSTMWKPEYYDLGSCIYHWTGEDGYSEWLPALEEAIPYRYLTGTWLTEYNDVRAVMTDAAHYAGASMYVPFDDRETYNAAWRSYEWWETVGQLLER